MKEPISVCGAKCTECKYYKNLCQGCAADKGQPFWCADFFEDKTCPLFKCAVNEKKYQNCGECDDLPCRIFFELKDPEINDEDHKKSINNRVNALKTNK